jgi:hypothetical protein
MRVAGRIMVVMASAGVPSAVALVACEPTTHFPGLQDELNNRTGVGTPVATSSSGSSGSGSSSSGFQDAGPAQSLCDCAVAETAAVSGCTTCQNMSCAVAYTTCLQAPNNDCSNGIMCVDNCVTSGSVASADGGSCVAACLMAHPAYTTFVQCLDSMCAARCGWVPPLNCPFDAGPG